MDKPETNNGLPVVRTRSSTLPRSTLARLGFHGRYGGEEPPHGNLGPWVSSLIKTGHRSRICPAHAQRERGRGRGIRGAREARSNIKCSWSRRVDTRSRKQQHTSPPTYHLPTYLPTCLPACLPAVCTRTEDLLAATCTCLWSCAYLLC